MDPVCENVFFIFDITTKIIIAAFKTYQDAQKIQMKLNDIDRLTAIDRLELKINKLMCDDTIDKDKIKKLTLNICQIKNTQDKQIIINDKQISRYIIQGINICSVDDFDFDYPYKKCLILNI